MYLGLTGGIASGKSAAAKILSNLGCYCLDLDDVSRIVTAPSTNAYIAVVEEFGKRILNQDGTINRKELGSIVFSDDQARSTLENIVHPEIFEYEKRWLGKIKGKDNSAIAIVHAALLVEKHLETKYTDGLILVYASEEAQINRLMMRDAITRDDALKRLATQLSWEEKLSKGNFVINNDSTLENLVREVNRVFQMLKTYQYTDSLLKKRQQGLV